MVKRLADAVTPPALLRKVLQAAAGDILVGGQALAFWMLRFGLRVPEGVVAVTADVDFLTHSAAAVESVRRYARALEGDVFLPNEGALTALVGQAYLSISDAEKVNVDVLWSVLGFAPGEVEKRAPTVTLAGTGFRVMHPLHVLRSRLVNLHKLVEKQQGAGAMQLCLAIEVGREFLREQARMQSVERLASGRSPLLPLISEVSQMALQDAGRKVADRYGLHVADAIDPVLIPAGPFWTKRWPDLKGLMSPAYAAGVTPPTQSASKNTPSPRARRR